MSTIRVEKDKNYSVISNTPLQDKNLSLKAKGLLALVLTLPENWDYSINGIVKIVKESRDAVMTAFDELEKNGYLKREQNRAKGGKFSKITYIFYENPQNKLPQSDFPDTGKPISEKPISENPIQKNTNIKKYLNKKINNNKNDGVTKVTPSFKNDNALDVAKKLRDNILEIRPNARVPKTELELNKWALETDKIFRIDKRDIDEVYKVLEYIKTNDFWRKNILSPASLRKHFDRLAMYLPRHNQNINSNEKPNTKSVGKADLILNDFMSEGDFYG